jgi:hypothetical protein
MRSLADFITITFGFRFSVHTGTRRAEQNPFKLLLIVCGCLSPVSVIITGPTLLPAAFVENIGWSHVAVRTAKCAGQFQQDRDRWRFTPRPLCSNLPEAIENRPATRPELSSKA